jgi:hypothetical protein
MVVRLSASRASRPLLPVCFLVLISVRGWVDPRATVRLEGLGQMKNLAHRESNLWPSGLRHSTSTNYIYRNSLKYANYFTTLQIEFLYFKTTYLSLFKIHTFCKHEQFHMYSNTFKHTSLGFRHYGSHTFHWISSINLRTVASGNTQRVLPTLRYTAHTSYKYS